MQSYLIGNGGLLAKHAWKHPNLARPTYWDVKNAVKEILSGGISTTGLPYFSHRDKVAYSIRGALRYFFMRKGKSASRIAGTCRLAADR
jgi:hypothetical protein